MLWGTEEKEHPPPLLIGDQKLGVGLALRGWEDTGCRRHEASEEGLRKETGEEGMVLSIYQSLPRLYITR